MSIDLKTELDTGADKSHEDHNKFALVDLRNVDKSYD